jgi:hypothetical protein
MVYSNANMSTKWIEFQMEHHEWDVCGSKQLILNFQRRLKLFRVEKWLGVNNTLKLGTPGACTIKLFTDIIIAIL